MQKLNLLIQKYVSSSSQSGSHHSMARIHEFQSIIANITKVQGGPLKIKYTFYHISFLLQTLSEGPGCNSLLFTPMIQILNILLRQAPSSKLQSPNKLMRALNDYICSNQNYLNSPKVITNVIWLVGRCIQMGNDRTTLVNSLSQSKLIQTCLQCPQYDSSTAKGMALMIGYMCKRQLVKKQFCLKLLPNLIKFTQKDTIREVLLLLRKIGIEKVKLSQEMLQNLGIFLTNYFSQSQVQEYQKYQHWPLLVLISAVHTKYIHTFNMKAVMVKVLSESSLDISQELLNKSHEVLSQIIEANGQEEIFLRTAIDNIFTNAVARRIFIQYHQKINSSFFLEILSGNIPSIIEEKIEVVAERNKILKILICLKRSASFLGLDVFYEFKFKQLSIKMMKEGIEGEYKQLMDLWHQVSAETMNINKVNDFFY